MFGLPSRKCDHCNTFIEKKNGPIFDMSSVDVMKMERVSMKHIFNLLIRKISNSECCSYFKSQDENENIIIIRFSCPVNVTISSHDECFAGTLTYKSHVEERIENQCCCFFAVNEKIYYQNSSGMICQSKYGYQRNIVLLALKFSPKKSSHIKLHQQDLVYGSKVQCSLQRKYLSIMNPEKNEIKRLQQREYELNRNKDETRKAYRRASDQARDQTIERKTSWH